MKILNFIVFQAAWFITVFSASLGFPYAGVGFTCLWMFFHLASIGEKAKHESMLLVLAALLGYLTDSLLVLTGFIAFPEQAALGGPSPLWMVALWVNLAATINYSLSWLKSRMFLAGLLGAAAGPMAYAAGEKIGAIVIVGIPGLAFISLVWMCAMPALIVLANTLSSNPRLNRQQLSAEME